MTALKPGIAYELVRDSPHKELSASVAKSLAIRNRAQVAAELYHQLTD